MSKRDMIEKALVLNNVEKDNVVVIKTDTTTTFSIHLLRILVHLLLNFAFQPEMTANELYDFIMQNFNEILDTTITELECALLNFCNMYEEELAEEIELNNKDETMLILIIQDKVNKKLKKYGGLI